MLLKDILKECMYAQLTQSNSLNVKYINIERNSINAVN
ncbi:hypothetical protein [Lactobacillus phage KC5a]|nr:hypothetical protein [Lactobacillus phage KC5a]ABD78807.1 hypothetical protein [Lactobacillus phage KC5a]DAJ79446.1 MAG TPA: hypothetical protein [Caudoviricetes sp.]